MLQRRTTLLPRPSRPAGRRQGACSFPRPIPDGGHALLGAGYTGLPQRRLVLVLRRRRACCCKPAKLQSQCQLLGGGASESEARVKEEGGGEAKIGRRRRF
jgi:hypothetical protein